MTAEQLELLLQYIDAVMEYQIASNTEGADGHTVSAVNERKKVELLKQMLKETI
jgi:hypothetical protein